MAFSPKYSAFISQNISCCGQAGDCNDGQTMIIHPECISTRFLNKLAIQEAYLYIF